MFKYSIALILFSALAVAGQNDGYGVCTKTAQPLTFLPPVVVTVPCPYPAPYKGYNDGGPPPIVTYVDYNLPSVTSTVVLDPVTTTGTM
ncbi:hypothetical protein BB559_000251 [Furculomyces boomerangus]|uniref:Secreted protein n=1 Tax=Furculomyces boomerangus TaxID=61424 RepID=A0A2T9Z5W7_9FUNG|nr:hypothetical protein BB559_000251 [Furculomyces boomerangus]